MNRSKSHLSRLAMLLTSISTLVALVIGLKRLPSPPVEEVSPAADTSTNGPDSRGADSGEEVPPAPPKTLLPQSIVTLQGIPVYARWLIFIALTIASVLLLTSPWSGATTVFFALLVAASLGIAYASGARIPLLASYFADVTAWMMPRRRLISWGLTVLAVVLFSVSAYRFRTVNHPGPLYQTVWLTLFSGLVLGLAIWLRPPQSDAPHLQRPTLTTPETQSFTLRWRWFLPGVLGIWLFSEISGRVFKIGPLYGVSTHIQFALLCISTVLVIRGVSDGFGFNWRRFLRQDGWLLAVIGIVGFFLRFWGLDWTVRTLADEIHFLSGVVSIWHYDHVGLMTPMAGLSPFPWIYPYWQTITVSLWGNTLTGLRATSSILGTIHILALYLMVRALFDRKAALLSALMLMAFPPHIHFSRISIIQIADPLFATFGFAFIGRGMRYNRRTDYALGGAGIAFSQYFYEAGRLFFPPLAILWLTGVTFFNRRWLHTHWRGLLTFALVFIVLSVPVYYTLIVMEHPVAKRLESSGLDDYYWHKLFSGGDEALNINTDKQMERLRAPWLFYVQQPETGSVYYGGTEPLVIGVIIPLFLLGVFHALWRLRVPGMMLLIGWLLANSLGNSLLVQSAVASRYLVIYPVLALFIALSIRYTIPLLWPSVNNTLQASLRVVLVGSLILAVVVVQIAYYFGPHLEAYQTQARPTYDIHDAVLRAAEFPPDTHVYIVTSAEDDKVGYGREMLSFFNDQIHLEGMKPEDITPEFAQKLEKGVDHAFFIEPGDTDTPQWLRRWFVVDGPQSSPYPMPPHTQYFLYYVSHDKNSDTLGDTCDG